MKPVDIVVSLPRDGEMRLVSRYFFGDPRAEACRQFIGRIFEVEEVRAVEVLASRAQAHVEYVNGVVPCREVIAKISRHLRHGENGARAPYVNSPRDLPAALADRAEGWRIERHGQVLSTWEIRHELPGRIRFRNRLIRRQPALCGAIERALRRVLGVERHATSPHTATTLVVYDPGRVDREGLLGILDRALVDAQHEADAATEVAGQRPPRMPQPFSMDRPWSTGNLALTGLALGLSAAGAFVYPPLSLLAIPVTVYPTRGLYVHGWRALVRERKVTVDGLLIGVNALSVAYGHVFLFCLNNFAFQVTRGLLDKVKSDARADYTDVFRQQARTVWVRVDGVEIETPLAAVKSGDLVSIAAGQTIPVDGHVVEGAASVDQHLLTGEAVPADKGVGEPVFAMTVVLSGQICVRVEKAGAATAAAHIAQVLDRTVDFKTGRQLRAERLADRLVGPTLVSGLIAWPPLGLEAAGALLDSHPKYKTTLASSLGLLNYFTLAARQGILIKDGRTLELLTEVDTVVFDKTGTLTLGEPRVGRVHACPPHAAHDVLRLAAAAEQHQSHPIARAIRHAARAGGVDAPPLAEAEYRVGYGLTVTVEGRLVRVGSMRFIDVAAIAIPPALVDVQRRCHREGHSLVLVAIDHEVAGAIELHAALRPEATRIVQALRQRGIGSLYVISGDHEVPTRRLAEGLGIERYFAETLPEDKAALIEGLQAAGRVVCYVGDGINDSIAMKQSHVSVSLRGASTLATDTAEVVLLDESLNQLPRLFDIARECRANTTTTMAAVLIPSLFCAGGIVLFGFGFAHARLLNVAGLLTGVGAAMLPLVGDRRRPALTSGAASSDPPWAEAPREACVIP